MQMKDRFRTKTRGQSIFKISTNPASKHSKEYSLQWFFIAGHAHSAISCSKCAMGLTSENVCGRCVIWAILELNLHG